MKIKKTLSLLLSMICIVGMLQIPTSAADQTDPTVAEITFTETGAVTTDNVSVKMGPKGDYAYTVAEKDGRIGWTVNPKKQLYDPKGTALKSSIYVDLSKDYAYRLTDGSSYEVTVDYYDEGAGVFRILYDGVTEPWKAEDDKSIFVEKKTEIIKMAGDKKWKSHTFLIQDPRFANGIQQSDFFIALWEPDMGSQGDPVTFGKITVKPAETNSLVKVNMHTEAIGNNFFKGENVKFDLDFYNQADVDKTVTAKFTSKDYYGDEGYSKTFEVTVPAQGMVKEVLDFVPEKYMVYDSVLTVEGDGVKYVINSAYSYSIPSEKKHPQMGTNHHMMWKFDRIPSKLMPLTDKSGYSAIRDGYKQGTYETSKGSYGISERALEVSDWVEKYGLEHMINVNADDSLYGSDWNKDAAVMEPAYLKYVEELVKENKDRYDYWEHMNEMNHHARGASAVWYAEISEKVYEILSKEKPDINFVLGGLSGLPAEYIREMLENYDGKLNAVSGHPYATYNIDVPPDVAGLYDQLLAARNVLNDCGHNDVHLTITEAGWSTAWKGITYEKQAAYLQRYMAIVTRPELNINKAYFYDFCDDYGDSYFGEGGFGIIESFDNEKVPYLAKPSYVAICNFNNLLADAAFVEQQNKGTVETYEYRGSNGDEILLAWQSEYNVGWKSFDLGGSNVKVYDMYGNEMDVYNKDGIYSLQLGWSPVYFIGDIEKFEECESEITVTESSMVLPYGDIAEIVVEQNVDEAAEIEFITPENGFITVLENNGFVDNKAVVKIEAKGVMGRTDECRIKVKAADGSNIVDNTFYISYDDVIDVSFRTEPYDDRNLRRWVGIYTITNRKHSAPVTGQIKFNSPTNYAEKLGYIRINEIAPGETKEVRFNIPEIKYCESFYMDTDVILDNGYSQNFNLYLDFSIATYADVKPTVDGYKTPGEWTTPLPFKILENRVAWEDNKVENHVYTGNSDISASLWIEWDEEFYYMFVDATDDVFDQSFTSSNIWNGDSIQLGISWTATQKSSTQLTEIGLALTSAGAEIYRWSNEEGCTARTSDRTEFAVRREGNHIYYELKMPWDELVSAEAPVFKKGDEVRFNILINDSDRPDRWGWVEYSRGIGEKKDANLFGHLKLL